MNNKVQEIMKEIEKNPNIKLWKDFTWPDQIPLTTRLKDILEKTVNEKYYLSGDKVESILANFIARQNEASGINIKNQATTFDGLTDVAHTLMARDYKGFGNQSMTGVIEPSIDEDVNPVRIGNIYGEQFGTGYAGNVWDQDSISPTIMTAQGGNRQPLVVDNIKWRIRKLTPKECWRLMSFSDEDYNRASKYVSDSALYKQAGNSIVTSCLVAIFYSLLFNDNGTNWSDYIVQYKINGGNV